DVRPVHEQDDEAAEDEEDVDARMPPLERAHELRGAVGLIQVSRGVVEHHRGGRDPANPLDRGQLRRRLPHRFPPPGLPMLQACHSLLNQLAAAAVDADWEPESAGETMAKVGSPDVASPPSSPVTYRYARSVCADLLTP